MCEPFEAAVVMETETWAPGRAPQLVADSLEFQSSHVLSKRVNSNPSLPDLSVLGDTDPRSP